MSDQLKIGIVGASGRMGTKLLELLGEDSELSASAAIVDPASNEIGDTFGPQKLEASGDFDTAASESDALIDLSAPPGTMSALESCLTHETPLVIGTTGLDDAQLQSLREGAKQLPILKAANFSVGINLLSRLVSMTSEATAGDFDIEIFEAHHNQKADAPSGTALSLGEAAAKARDQSLDEDAIWGRHGETGARSDSEIGFQVLRGGDIKGEHTVYFCGDGERIELTHRASSRDIFAQGALRAAVWLTGQPAGSYDMSDLLFD